MQNIFVPEYLTRLKLLFMDQNWNTCKLEVIKLHQIFGNVKILPNNYSQIKNKIVDIGGSLILPKIVQIHWIVCQFQQFVAET